MQNKGWALWPMLALGARCYTANHFNIHTLVSSIYFGQQQPKR